MEYSINIDDLTAHISLHGITEIAHRETIRAIFEKFEKSSGWGVLYQGTKSVLVLYLNLRGVTFISRAALDEILCQNDRLGGHIINLRNLCKDIAPAWFVVKRTHRRA